MPDWRNPADYEYTADLTLHGWAWEFLRRNPEYRERWRQIQPDAPDAWESMVTLGDAFGLWVAADPSRDFFEARPEWSIGSGVKILRSYQSSLLDDPQGKPLPWPGWPVHVALLFDLSEDVGVQIREAEARLRRRQHEAAADLASRVIRPDARPQPQKFAAYIRALDGHEGGASQLEIGRVPFPEIGPRMDADAVRAAERERKNAAHAIRAARQLAGGGYRDLLFKPEI